MRKIILAALCAATIFAVSCSSKKTPVVERLHVEGTQLYAGDSLFVERGVSYGWHNIWPRFYNEQSVATLKNDWNVKIVRAAIGSDDIAKADNPGIHGGYKEEPDYALEHLYKVIDGAIANGMYVIVDWHSHITYKHLAGEFFRTVAAKYKGVPNVIYELYNEPVCFSFEGDGENKYEDLGNPEKMAEYWNMLKDYAEYIAGIIKGEDPSEPLILMGCPSWDQRIDLPAANSVQGYKNIMYTVHFYAATHKDSLREATRAAVQSGIPVFISECAACEASGDGPMDMESWNQWCSLSDELGLTMMVWSLSDKDETCSMLSKEASSEGPWDEAVVKPWGKVVTEWICAK